MHKAFAVLALLTGCATFYNPRSDPPDLVATSADGPADAAGCLVQELNILAPFGADYPHHALMLVPDRQYEVAISRPLTATGGEMYLLSVDGDASGSMVRLYALWNLVDDVLPAFQTCGMEVV